LRLKLPILFSAYGTVTRLKCIKNLTLGINNDFPIFRRNQFAVNVEDEQ
jgi:hypothetical protein